MAHDPGQAQALAGDKVARVLTSDSTPPQNGNQVGNQGGGSSSRAPIQEYSIERVEKVYRSVPPIHE